MNPKAQPATAPLTAADLVDVERVVHDGKIREVRHVRIGDDSIGLKVGLGTCWVRAADCQLVTVAAYKPSFLANVALDEASQSSAGKFGTDAYWLLRNLIFADMLSQGIPMERSRAWNDVEEWIAEDVQERIANRN